MRVLFAAVLLAVGAGQSPQWPFTLEWEHSGVDVTQFQLCVDGTCSALAATRVTDETWSAPLPLLPQGLHTLIVNACNGTLCSPGAPTLTVNVTATGPDLTTNPNPNPNPNSNPNPTPPPTTQVPNRAPPRHPPK